MLLQRLNVRSAWIVTFKDTFVLLHKHNEKANLRMSKELVGASIALLNI